MSADHGSRSDEPDDLTTLSDRELRAAWRASCERLRRLQDLADSVGAAEVSAERDDYVQELQRRDLARGSSLVGSATAPGDRGRGPCSRVPHQRRPSEP